MKVIDLQVHLARVERRKSELGLLDTPEMTGVMRNEGWNRTPEKRELLRRAEARGALSGKPGVVSRY